MPKAVYQYKVVSMKSSAENRTAVDCLFLPVREKMLPGNDLRKSVHPAHSMVCATGPCRDWVCGKRTDYSGKKLFFIFLCVSPSFSCSGIFRIHFLKFLKNPEYLVQISESHTTAGSLAHGYVVRCRAPRAFFWVRLLTLI